MKQNLTDTYIKNLKAQAKKVEISDELVAGLMLRISPKGKKTWLGRYRTDKLVIMKLGNYPAMSLAEARQYWGNLQLNKKRTGQAPKQAIDEERQQAEQAEAEKHATEKVTREETVEHLIERYVDYVSTKNSSWKEYKRCLNKELAPIFGTLAVDVTRADIRNLFNAKLASGSKTMANKIVIKTKSMYNWAIKNEVMGIEANPAMMIDTLPEKSCERYLKDWEMRKIFSQFEKLGKYADICRLSWLTGSRIGEACNVEWKEINLEEGEWTIPYFKAKNRKQHTIFLSPQAITVLNRQKEASTGNYVFPCTHVSSDVYRPTTISEKIKKIDWGIDKWTPHASRRSLGTWLGNNEVSYEIQDRMLNHVVSDVRGIYNRARYDNPAKEQWLKWGQHIASLQADNVVTLGELQVS